MPERSVDPLFNTRMTRVNAWLADDTDPPDIIIAFDHEQRRLTMDAAIQLRDQLHLLVRDHDTHT